MTMQWQRFSNPRPRKHKQVEFHVDDAGGKTRIFDTSVFSRYAIRVTDEGRVP